VPHRPFMVEAWELVQFLRNKRKGLSKDPVGRVPDQVHSRRVTLASHPALIPQWLNSYKIQADLITHTFPDGCALKEVEFTFASQVSDPSLPPLPSPLPSQAPLSLQQDRIYILFMLFACGVFFWLPACGLILLMTLPWASSLAIILTFYTIVLTFPVKRSETHPVPLSLSAPPSVLVASSISWPPSYRLSYLMQCAVNYFSVRVIVDAPHDTATPSVYSMEPHGWLPIPQSIHVPSPSLSPSVSLSLRIFTFLSSQQLLNEWILGENFHLLGANSIFYMPIFNIIAKV
jgi:hypothetical protein